MKTVRIPNTGSLWVCFINGARYAYEGGSTQNVPDEVADLIASSASVFPPAPTEPEDPFVPDNVAGGYVKPSELDAYAKLTDLSDYAKKADLPMDYQGQDSMDELTAVLGTALGGTITKTWDSANKKYTYTFTESGS